jgi:dCMP deaminase
MVECQPPIMPEPSGRPGWDEYFLAICKLVSLRSTCLRRKVGAILVRDRRMLSTGYNGAPSGVSHCRVTGCERQARNIPSGERAEICRGLHAEQNVIIQAAFHGVSIAGSTLYCTNQPCSICVKMLINAGIKEIVYEDGYPDPLAEKLLQEAEIRVRRFGGEEKP